MSFRILRGFLNTAFYDSKIIVGGKLKVDRQWISECITELGVYAALCSPIVVVCNRFANANPRLDRAAREAVEEHHRRTDKVVFVDGGKELRRCGKAVWRLSKENTALELQIEVLKEERKKRELAVIQGLRKNPL